MLIQIIVTICLGIISGTFTGLTPGIHINLISVFLIYLSSIFNFINPIYLIVFISSMAITHTFIDFIPSIFLGCPDTDTELSILPGHDLLKQGQGYEAILLTCYGSLAAIFLLVILVLPSLIFIPKINNFINSAIPFILIISSIFLISQEKRKISASVVFVLSGFLGFCALNIPSLNQPLLPLLSGLFGGSILITSIKNKTQIPKQEITKPKIKIIKPLIGSLIASPLCGFLPGLGSGQAAVIGNTIARTNKKEFLVLIGATNTLVMGFSFVILHLIAKTRTGAASAIKEIIGPFNSKLLILILGVIVITGISSFFIAKKLAKFFSQKIDKINYAKLSLIILIFLSLVILIISHFIGLVIFVIATFTGIYCSSLKVRKTQMIGCLLIPTILFYLIG